MTEEYSQRSRHGDPSLLAELVEARNVARRYFWLRTPTARQMEEDMTRYDWLTREPAERDPGEREEISMQAGPITQAGLDRASGIITRTFDTETNVEAAAIAVACRVEFPLVKLTSVRVNAEGGYQVNVAGWPADLDAFERRVPDIQQAAREKAAAECLPTG